MGKIIDGIQLATRENQYIGANNCRSIEKDDRNWKHQNKTTHLNLEDMHACWSFFQKIDIEVLSLALFQLKDGKIDFGEMVFPSIW